MSRTYNGHSSISVDALGFPFPTREMLERWHAGNVSCLNACVTIWGDTRETLSLVGSWHRVMEENRDIVEPATSVADVLRIAEKGKLAIILGFQNTSPIEHDLDMFRVFRQLGVCIMQLTYNLQNFIGAGCWEERDTGISSQFGKKAIAEMNRLGILIDLSHCGDRTTREAIDISSRPVSITHGNPRAFVGDSNFGAHRLRETEAIKALASRGGVIGLSPNPHMLKNRAETTVPEFCEMVAWTCDLVGVEHVGIGSDYCPGHPPGTRAKWRYGRWSHDKIQENIAEVGEGWQSWMQSTADFQVLRKGLTEFGFGEADVNRIMGENFIRLFGDTLKPETI